MVFWDLCLHLLLGAGRSTQEIPTFSVFWISISISKILGYLLLFLVGGLCRWISWRCLKWISQQPSLFHLVLGLVSKTHRKRTLSFFSIDSGNRLFFLRFLRLGYLIINLSFSPLPLIIKAIYVYCIHFRKTVKS